MVLCNSECVGGRKIGGVRVTVGGEVLRPPKCRLEKSDIANSRTAAMLRKLLVVDREHDGLCDPLERHYLASSRSRIRSCFMISRASVICFSNCGSYGVMR